MLTGVLPHGGGSDDPWYRHTASRTIDHHPFILRFAFSVRLCDVCGLLPPLLCTWSAASEGRRSLRFFRPPTATLGMLHFMYRSPRFFRPLTRYASSTNQHCRVRYAGPTHLLLLKLQLGTFRTREGRGELSQTHLSWDVHRGLDHVAYCHYRSVPWPSDSHSALRGSVKLKWDT